MSENVHLVVPDLLLPGELARQAGAGLHLPGLEKILSRARAEPLQDNTLEGLLCTVFGMAGQGIAPVTLQTDRVEAGGHYWLRADPVNLRILRDQLVLQPVTTVNTEEAAQLCAALNEHFAADGLHFMAPHPQRWYLRLETAPGIETALLAQVLGKNIHHFLPQGREGLRWHGILNEIQMLLHAHPLNEVREQRSEWQINGVWLWGGGHAVEGLRQAFSHVYADDDGLATAFAAAAGVAHGSLPESEAWLAPGAGSDVLVVWNGLRDAMHYGDLEGWRRSAQQFEQRCAYPLWQALRSGSIEKITLDVPQENFARRFVLARRDSRKFWRRTRPLAGYSLM